MPGIQEPASSPLTAISNAMVRLHKEHFGRGPSNVRSHFAGPDGLLCILEDVLLPAERKLVEMGDHERVRETRMAFQVATTDEFVSSIEQIVNRKVRAFSSGTDVTQNVVFESFVFEPETAGGRDGGPSADGRQIADRLSG